MSGAVDSALHEAVLGPARARVLALLRAALAAAVPTDPAAGIPSTPASIEAAASCALDPAMLPLLRRHQLLEVVGGLLEHAPAATGLPAAVAEARAAQAQRSARLLGHLGRVLAALRAAGIEPLLLKGLGLTMRAYGALDRRATRDIDLLVRPADLARAEAVLGELGFRRASWVPCRRAALACTHALDYVAQDPGGEVTIDLHFTLARHPSFRFDVEGLFARRQRVALGETAAGPVAADIPGDEDALAMALLAAFRDLSRGALAYRAFADVRRLLALIGDALDPVAFLAKRRAEGTEAIALHMLALSDDAVGLREAAPRLAATIDERAEALLFPRRARLELLVPGRLALANRRAALRLYAVPAWRSAAFWLATLPVRVLVYRSWRRKRRPKAAAVRGASGAAS